MQERRTGPSGRLLWPCFAFVAASTLGYAFAVNWMRHGVDPLELVQILAFTVGWRAWIALFAVLALLLAVTYAGLAFLASAAMLRNPWWKGGTLFGVLAYAIAVGGLSLAVGKPFPDPDRLNTALGLFPAVVFIGWPLALAARGRIFTRRPRSS